MTGNGWTISFVWRISHLIAFLLLRLIERGNEKRESSCFVVVVCWLLDEWSEMMESPGYCVTSRRFFRVVAKKKFSSSHFKGASFVRSFAPASRKKSHRKIFTSVKFKTVSLILARHIVVYLIFSTAAAIFIQRSRSST